MSSPQPNFQGRRKGKQLLKPTMTLGQAQVIDDDIVYLSID